MPLKKSDGNMYTWVSHTHSHLGGECSHKCKYCYVAGPRHKRPEKYCGPLVLLEDELSVPYGSGNTIFVEHMNDLFADDVPGTIISRILAHCHVWPDNLYVLQTKNTMRMFECQNQLPIKCLLGTTIETNREMRPDISMAPSASERSKWLGSKCLPGPKFITIEPILDFDLVPLVELIRWVNPSFVTIGADSKRHSLPEPSPEKVRALIAVLGELKIEIREKHNLERLLTA